MFFNKIKLKRILLYGEKYCLEFWIWLKSRMGKLIPFKPIYAFLALTLVIILAIFIFILPQGSSDLPSAKVQYGDFRIEMTATGEVQATRSINISAPRVATNLQIVRLIPEGTVVNQGDFLIQFDTNELQKTIDDKQSELEIAEANLQRSKASIEANMAQLQSALENDLASYELAKLRLSQMAFEAEVMVQEEKLRLRQSEISLEQSRQKIESQKKMDAADLTTLELKIQQARAELTKAQEQMKQLTVLAPAPGLVVYQQMWKGNNMEKIKVGDSPWRGQALIQLPDLSAMQVESEISEADIGKLRPGQLVTIKLDAYPDPTFSGYVAEIASLAHEKEGENEIKVFDLVIRINETDPILKPGMTAKAKILIEEVPNCLSLAIEAVFDWEGKQVVFPLEGKKKYIPVKPGKRNENSVIVEGKLKEGQLISLVNPFLPIEAPKEKEALSPDLNSGKKVKNKSPRPHRR